MRFSLRQKTRLAALRVRGDVLVLQTLLWADEVREAAFPALDEPVRISAKELELSASLVESFASDFDPSEFADEYQDELRTLIEAKIEQGDALDTSETFGEHEEEDTGGEVIDLMEALRASVERSRAAREGKASSKDAAAKPAAKQAGDAKTSRDEAARRSRRRRSRREEEAREGVLTATARAVAVGVAAVGGARGRGRRPRGRARGASASSASVTTSSPAAAAFFALRRSRR